MRWRTRWTRCRCCCFLSLAIDRHSVRIPGSSAEEGSELGERDGPSSSVEGRGLRSSFAGGPAASRQSRQSQPTQSKREALCRRKRVDGRRRRRRDAEGRRATRDRSAEQSQSLVEFAETRSCPLVRVRQSERGGVGRG